MIPLDYDEGKVKYSSLYGRGNKVTILVCHHFQSEMLPMERASKQNVVVTHFCLKIGDLTKSALFWWAYHTPLRSSSMSLLPREAQNLLHISFSCMLIPFSMFSLDYDISKVKYSTLYGWESKETILVVRHFQSGMLPMETASKNT